MATAGNGAEEGATDIEGAVSGGDSGGIGTGEVGGGAAGTEEGPGGVAEEWAGEGAVGQPGVDDTDEGDAAHQHANGQLVDEYAVRDDSERDKGCNGGSSGDIRASIAGDRGVGQ